MPLLHQLVAEQMRHELASRRLEVVLVPSPVEFWPTDQQRRVVCERNPAWYRQLCQQHPSRRSRPRRRQKPDTCIKRRHVLRALGEIEDGRLDTEYARRVYPFVEKAAADYKAQFARKRGQSASRSRLMLTDYDLVQELPGQKLHMVPGSAPSANGRPADVAICGRHNHRTNAWQRPLLVEASCICRNCLRVREARQKSKTKKEQQHAN